MSFLQLTVVGRVGRGAELRPGTSGQFATWNVAINHKVPSGSGAWTEETVWISCSMGGTRAESLAKYLTKGKQVCVIGTPSIRQFVRKDGTPAAEFKLSVKEIVLLGGESRESNRDQDRSIDPNRGFNSSVNPEESGDDDEKLPF